jgi:hypothetical protein
MIEPYQAVGLVPTMRGIRRRDEIAVNIEHISHLTRGYAGDARLLRGELSERLSCRYSS